MGLSIRTLDNGRVGVIDVDFESRPATGRVNGVTDTERYSSGDIIEFEGQSRTEVVEKSEISDLTGLDITEIKEITELGYIVDTNEDEDKHVKISNINNSNH